MSNTNQFRFDYPITDNNQSPAKHFTDLQVVAIAEIGRKRKVTSVNVTRIWFKTPGDIVSSDVKALLRVTNKALHDEICEAARQHAVAKYEEEILTD